MRFGASHVSLPCQNHDLRRVVSLSLRRIRLPGCPVSFDRCSIASNYQQREVFNESPRRARPRFLTAIKGTHTPIYVLKLSSKPSITKVLESPAFASTPYGITTVSAAHTRGSRHAVRFPNVPRGGFAPLHKKAGLDALPHRPFPCRPTPSTRAEIGPP